MTDYDMDDPAGAGQRDLGLSLRQSALLADSGTRVLRLRRQGGGTLPPPPARQHRRDRLGHPRHAAAPHPYTLPEPSSMARSSCTSCSGRPRWRSPCRSTAISVASARRWSRWAAPCWSGRRRRSSRVVVVGGLLGLPVAILASLGPKSVTTPIAMSLAAANGGIPVLTAVFVILTGVFGAVIVTPLMNAMRIRDFAARGFAAGLSAHGIGNRPRLPGRSARRCLRGHRAGAERRRDGSGDAGDHAGVAPAVSALSCVLGST